MCGYTAFSIPCPLGSEERNQMESTRKWKYLLFVIPSAFKYHGASVQIGRYQILIPVVKMETKKTGRRKTEKINGKMA